MLPPGRALRDDLGHRATAPGDDFLAQMIKIREVEFAHHFTQPLPAGLIAGNKRIDVAHHLHRLSHIGTHNAKKVFIHPPLTRKVHERNIEAFVINLPPFGTDA